MAPSRRSSRRSGGPVDYSEAVLDFEADDEEALEADEGAPPSPARSSSAYRYMLMRCEGRSRARSEEEARGKGAGEGARGACEARRGRRRLWKAHIQGEEEEEAGEGQARR